MMSNLLPLYPGAQPCLRSGWCCEQGPCPFGAWDAEHKKCSSLSYDAAGRANCDKFDEITSSSTNGWEFAPAFGAGCCASFNTKRLAILTKLRSQEQMKGGDG